MGRASRQCAHLALHPALGVRAAPRHPTWRGGRSAGCFQMQLPPARTYRVCSEARPGFGHRGGHQGSADARSPEGGCGPGGVGGSRMGKNARLKTPGGRKTGPAQPDAPHRAPPPRFGFPEEISPGCRQACPQVISQEDRFQQRRACRPRGLLAPGRGPCTSSLTLPAGGTAVPAWGGVLPSPVGRHRARTSQSGTGFGEVPPCNGSDPGM